MKSNVTTSSLIFLYGTAIIGTFLYSFTQIDLSLTFSDSSLLYPIQQFFQGIGYFNRPFSAGLYSVIMSLLYVLYMMLYKKATLQLVNKKTVWIVIGATALLLLFAYPAFSYDLYNYLFDARIITLYQENPYLHKALDYPDDPWINFMRWTHRTYPYGPGWLIISVPLSFLGFQKFVITLYLFKSLMAASYVASVVAIQKILKKTGSSVVLSGTILFALNPLVLIESLVSAHNDIVMMALALWSLYALMQKKYGWSVVLLLISVSIKFATILLLPAYAYALWTMRSGTKVDWEKIMTISTVSMLFAVVAASMRTQFQPWYLLYVLPFAALLPPKTWINISVFVVSVAGSLQYVPYLYTGNWDPPIPAILNGILLVGVAVSVGAALLHKRL